MYRLTPEMKIIEMIIRYSFLTKVIKSDSISCRVETVGFDHSVAGKALAFKENFYRVVVKDIEIEKKLLDPLLSDMIIVRDVQAVAVVGKV